MTRLPRAALAIVVAHLIACGAPPDEADRGSAIAPPPPAEGVREIPVRHSAELGEERGGADLAPIHDAVRAHASAFRDCYETSLRRAPTLEGRIVVAMTVREDGSVERASIESDDIGDERLAECIAATAGRIRCARGVEGGSVSVRFPFTFAPQREE